MNDLKYLAEYLLLENSQYSEEDLEKMMLAYYDKIGKVANAKENGFNPIELKQMDRHQLYKMLLDIFKESPKVKESIDKHKPEDEIIATINGEIVSMEKKVSSKNDEPEESDDYEDNSDHDISVDVKQEKWPTYAEFRRKYYKMTCDAGWPRDLIPDTRNPLRMGNIRLPWQDNDHTAYVFNSRGIGMLSLKNYTKNIQTYLYNEYKNDTKGIQNILSIVEDALVREQTFFKGRAVRKFIVGLVGLAFRGLGFNDRDAAIFKYISSKIRGMTIFEYQKMILTECDMKMSLSDTTVNDLKNMLYPLRNQIMNKMDGYNPTKVTPEYRPQVGYVCSFKIESTKQDKNVFPGQSMIDFINTICIPLSQGTLTDKSFKSSPTVESLQRIVRQLETLKSKNDRSENIAKSVGQLIQYRSDRYNYKTDSLDGTYIIRVRYQPFRAIVEVVYKSAAQIKKESESNGTK